VIVLAVIVYSLVVAVVIPLTSPSGEALLASALRIPGILLNTAIWVTAVFAAIEFFATRYPGKCPPSTAFRRVEPELVAGSGEDANHRTQTALVRASCG